ncbi:MAG: MarR family winged helix-turn-helix transcriptional regulator [Specibacter sp.]
MDSTPRDEDIQTVFDHLHEISRRANARSRTLGEPLTFVEHSLLRFIAATPGARATDIAAAFSLNRSTVSRQVNTLIELGLVHYQVGEAGRGRILALTDHGIAALARSAAVQHGIVTDRLSGWSDAEITSFAQALARYNDAG